MKTIGEIEPVKLLIYKGQDLDFDVTWAAPDGSAINFASVDAVLVDPDDPDNPLMDLSAYTTIDANVASVRVPEADVDELDVSELLKWKFVGTSTAGDVKILGRGPAQVKDEF